MLLCGIYNMCAAMYVCAVEGAQTQLRQRQRCVATFIIFVFFFYFLSLIFYSIFCFCFQHLSCLVSPETNNR